MTSASSPPTPRQVAEQLEAELHYYLSRIAPTEWDENHISFGLVQILRSVLAQTVRIGSPDARFRDRARPPADLQVEAYKISGNVERQHGDIAVLVAHDLLGYPMTGMGFYEAKAADPDGRYPAFQMRQLRRLVSATPRLSVLLYDRSPGPVLDDEFDWPSLSGAAGRSSVRVLGANVAARFNDLRHASLTAQSFGRQFVGRYLLGRDLDYSQKPVDALRRWLRVTKRAPPLLVSVALSAEPKVPLLAPIADYEPLPPAPSRLRLPEEPMRLKS